MVATVEDGRLTALRLDGEHPLSSGFACQKGNPAAFSYSHLFAALGFIKGIGRHGHYFTSSSQDTSSRLLASQFLSPTGPAVST